MANQNSSSQSSEIHTISNDDYKKARRRMLALSKRFLDWASKPVPENPEFDKAWDNLIEEKNG